MLERKLPLGVKSFAEPRHRGAVYADNRSCAYVLATRSWLQILTRACVFGKGMLLSTLEELFRHGVEPYDWHDFYFTELTIE
mgnify:CR=1 FL=1